jgi:hypothetical protein
MVTNMRSIEMDRKEVGWGGMDWIFLAQDMDQRRALLNGNETSGSIKFWRKFHEYVSD